jgi:hypothetical protein
VATADHIAAWHLPATHAAGGGAIMFNGHGRKGGRATDIASPASDTCCADAALAAAAVGDAVD